MLSNAFIEAAQLESQGSLGGYPLSIFSPSKFRKGGLSSQDENSSKSVIARMIGMKFKAFKRFISKLMANNSRNTMQMEEVMLEMQSSI